MSPTNVDPVRAARSRVASAVRLGQDPAPARRELAVAHIERTITAALTSPTPPTAEQRHALAALLTGGDER